MASKADTESVPAGLGVPRGASAALAVAALLAALGTSIANVALPALGAAFGAGLPKLQWVILAYLLAVTCAVVVVGRIGDRLGRRRLLLGGVALFTLVSLLCAAAPSLGLLIAGRAVQGVGAATMMALPMAMVRDAAPGGKIGRVMGLLGAASAAGTALGPALGGLLLAAAGWRALFLLCAAGGAAAMLLAWRALPAGPAPRCAATGEGLKAGPMVLLAATLACYALAASLGAGRFEAANLVLLAVAVAGVATFFRSERRSAAPLLGAELLRDAPLVRSLAAGALVAAVVMATLVVGPFYLAYGLDQNAAEIGVLLSAGPVVVALIGVPAGRLTDRHGARPVGLGGLALMLAGCGGLRLLPAAAGVPGYLLCITVTTGGYALFQTANNSFVLGRSPEERRGAAAGLLNLSRNLGFITGASAMASAFAAGLGGAEPSQAAPEAVAAAMRTTFALAAALILLALCLLGPKARGAKAG